MHVPINVKSRNNISEWQMEFNSAFKGLSVDLLRAGQDLYVSCKIQLFALLMMGDGTTRNM